MEECMQRRTFLQLGAAGLSSALAQANPVPPQFIPNASQKKWAVLFGSWYGTARDAAIWISEGMGAVASAIDVRQIPSDLDPYLEAVRTQHPDVFNLRQVAADPTTYDYLVVGTAIHGGKGPAILEAYLTKNADKLKNKIKGLFVVCGNLGKMPAQAQVTSYIDGYLAKLCKTSSVPSKALGGRITQVLMPASEYKSVTDLYAMMGGPSSDFDNLSRTDCMKLGKEIYAASS
jgi:menaquinone-dependent protoporphyrinogen IX oxidase